MSVKLEGRLYSTILFFTFRSLPFNFEHKSKAFDRQLSSSNAIVSFLHLSISYGVKSQLYLPANLNNR